MGKLHVYDLCILACGGSLILCSSASCLRSWAVEGEVVELAPGLVSAWVEIGTRFGMLLEAVEARMVVIAC